MSVIKNLRKPKIYGLAIFDLVTSILGTVIILLIAKCYHFRELPYTNFVVAGILLAIPIGIFIHIIFGTNTTLNYRLGLSNKVV